MTQNILLLNPTNDNRVSSDEMFAIGQALTSVCNRHFGVAWGVTAFITTTGKPDDPSVWPCRLLPTLDDPDAVAYHTRDLNGRPALLVGIDMVLDNQGTLSDGSLSISVATGHEIYEALVDPPCTIWSDMADGQREVAFEVVDPVQSAFYYEGGIAVPSFVFPAWFDPSAPKGCKFDQLGNLAAPLTMTAGGYLVTRTGGPAGTTTEIFGEEMPDAVKLYKHRHGRRTRAAEHVMRTRGKKSGGNDGGPFGTVTGLPRVVV